jgi:hypothetical protein
MVRFRPQAVKQESSQEVRVDEMKELLEGIRIKADRELVTGLWRERQRLVIWPTDCPGRPLVRTARVRYHHLPDSVRRKARKHGVSVDTRSNGPAVMAFELAGGVNRPKRAQGLRWSVHHIYDGHHTWPGQDSSVRAVADPQYFTDARGLVAAHPVFDAAAGEYAWLAWKLRLEAFDRFGFDPDGVLALYRERRPVSR